MNILKSDLRQINYAKFGAMLDCLTKQVQEYCDQHHVTFDLIVPILRSGGFTGLHLASKLGVTHVLPMQYKYVYHPEEHIVKRFEPPKLNFGIPVKANILIVDSNTVWGGIANKVIDDTQSLYPEAELFFASANLDHSYKAPGVVRQLFYGAHSNESRRMSANEEMKHGINHDIIIFPWEDLEEQWQEISGS